METDIHIQSVVNVYHCRTDEWKRNFFAPRIYDGIALFTEGEIEYCFSDKRLLAKKGDFVVLPGNLPYSGKKLSKTVGFFVIDFTCSQPTELERAVQASVFKVKNDSGVLERLSEIVDAWIKQRQDRKLQAKSFLYSVLCDAVQAEDRESRSRSNENVLAYICENIGNPTLTVGQLCKRFYISESQLRRNILKQTGLRPSEYIMKLRINMAKSELAYTSKSIVSISEACGFSSPYYFSNCFSRHTGVSPMQYRKSNLNKR